MLPKVLKVIEKWQTRGSKIRSANDALPPMQFIPTGSLLLDKAIGFSGYPLGKFVHLYGMKSAGKSLLTLIAASYVTRGGYGVIYCDLENNYNHPELNLWRVRLGVDCNHVVDIPGNQDGEAVMDMVIQLLKEFPDYFKMVVIDSIGALTSGKTADKDMAQGHIDDNPRLMSRFCRLLNVSNESATIFALSHMGANIGSLSPRPIPKGGNAIQHWSAVSLSVSGHAIPETKNDMGFCTKHEMDVYVEKNKISIPKGTAKKLLFNIETGTFDTLDELIELALNAGIITLKGSFFSIGEVKLHGRPAVREHLANYPELAYWLFQTVTGKSFEDYFVCNFG